MAAGLFHVINYIQKVDNGVVSSRTNKGGKYLKEYTVVVQSIIGRRPVRTTGKPVSAYLQNGRRVDRANCY